MVDASATRCWTSLHAHPAVRAVLPDTEQRVRRGELPAAAAAQQLLDTFLATPQTQGF